ncbi:hypothetical protein MMC21_002713 [Puttea exsequens]|nr:hypothetical protein [Puttea exsequens]
MDSTSEQWQVINALGQTVDPYSQDGTQEVEQLLLLDTARSQPNPPAIPSPLAGCSFVFSLPQSDNGKTEDRTCASFLTATCVNDIRFQAQKLALIIANAENVTLEDACKGMSTNLAILPESCPKASSGSTAGFSVIESSGINLTYSVADECSGGPKNIPIPIYQQTADIQGNDDSIYNQWAMTITPLLLAFFSNATFYAGSAFADTQLVCTTPRNIAAGSAPPRPPTKNAADPGTMVDMNSVLAAFFVLNALFFLVL